MSYIPSEFTTAAVINANTLFQNYDDEIQQLMTDSGAYLKSEMAKVYTETGNVVTNGIGINRVENIASLKLQDGLVFNTIEVLGYYTKGDGGGGTFYWDSTSTESDNGGTIIQATGVTTGRWKRATSSFVNIREFGAKGDGVTDDTIAIQKALGVSNYIVGNRLLTYKITTILKMNDYTYLSHLNLKSSGFDASLVSGKSVNNQGQIIELGNYCTIDNCTIDGFSTTTKSSGICNDGKIGCVISNNIIRNASSQAIQDTESSNCKYFGNTIYSMQHGIQLWKSNNTSAFNNKVYRVTGGIWTAMATNVKVYANEVFDCSDVGIDFEGGANCTAFGNNVYRCQNGEIAIFSGEEPTTQGNIKISNNILNRFSFYIDINGTRQENSNPNSGSYFISSLDDGNLSSIEFSNNLVSVEESDGINPTSTSSLRCIYTNVLSDSNTTNIIIKNNIFDSKSLISMFRIQEVCNFKFLDNTVTCHNTNNTMSTSEFKNLRNSNISRNRFITKASAKQTNNILRLYTDKSMDSTYLYFDNNSFLNCGDTPLKIDQFISDRTVKIENNSFELSPTGGILITNGYAAYKNQNCFISMVENTPLNTTSISMLANSVNCTSLGKVSTQMGGTQGAAYRVAFEKYNTFKLNSLDGSGSGSGMVGFTSTSRYCTFSSNTITLVDVDAGYLSYGTLQLTLDSYMFGA